jgi:signal transduction histidine kinase
MSRFLAVFLLWVGLVGASCAQPVATAHLAFAEVLATREASVTPPPQRVDSKALVGEWRAVPLPFAQPHDVLGQAADALSTGAGATVTWYRVHVPPQTGGSTPLMLYAARAKAYGPIAVYADGHLVSQWQLEDVPWYWAPLWVALDNGVRAAAPTEILVRMAHPAHTRTALASMWLGPSDAIGWRYFGRQWLQRDVPAMAGGAFLAVGLFAWGVWLRGGRDVVFLLFGILSIASFVRGLHYYVEWPVRDDVLGWLTVNSLFWLIGAVHHVQMRLHDVRMPRLSAVLHTIIAAVFIVTLPVIRHLPNTPDFSPLVYVLAMVTSPMVAIAGFRLSWRRSTDGMLVASTVIIGTAFGFNDWAIQNNLLGPEAWYLGPYANLFNFTLFSAITFRHYMTAVRGVKAANVVLGERLAAKELELRDSYERLREVERLRTLSEERQRLMQDMHDGLGSSLHSALRAVERGKADGAAMGDILRACIDDLRLTIDAMDPAHTDLTLLLATLRHRLGMRLAQAGIDFVWQVGDVPALPWLDPGRSLHVLRILQEALTNSLKHSNADRIELSAGESDGGVCIRIQDNGRGFDVAHALGAGGRGLRNQRRRADHVGARLSWHADAAGACTRLWLPLTEPLSPTAVTP